MTQVLSYLRQGEIVAIPTETVYGLAGNANDENAIRKIYTLKNRPLNHPLIMHVAQDWDLSRWVSHIPHYIPFLIEHFWPGPLTLVMPARMETISPLVTGGQESIALRCPKHPLAQNLLQQLGFPLVAPSANPFGKISPTTAAHVQHSFSQDNLLILEGGRCQLGIESTILDATHNEAYQILRHGSINESDIQAILPNMPLKNTSTLRSPGKLDRHYQPEKPLYCFPNAMKVQEFCQHTKTSVYVLTFTDLSLFPSVLSYQFPESPEQVAFELYYQLRRADQSAADLIAIELPPEGECWQAIRERILKAGS